MSVRLTITLLVVLTLFCVAGSLIFQQGQTQVPIEKLYSATTLKWLVAFGLTDIFHSAFFIFVMLMLAMNLLACSVERLPNIWRQTFHVPPPPVSDPTLSEWTEEEARSRKYILDRAGAAGFESVREAKMAAMLFFTRHFGKYTVLRDDDNQFQLMVEKGKFSRLGVYITHLSLLMIMSGGVLGALVGFEGLMSIEEGTRVSWMQHSKGSNAWMAVMRENGVPVPGFLNLGFEVECERFELETYDGSRPKAFRSTLNFYENDVLVHTAKIEVNEPAVYKGITFYQASYQEIGVGGVDLKVYRTEKSRSPSSEGTTGAQAKLPGAGMPGSGVPSMLKGQPMPKIESIERVNNVRAGELYRVDGDAAFKIVQVEKNLMELGPAAKVQFWQTRAAKTPREFWIFKNLPGFDFAHRRGQGLNFVLEDVKPKFATGLSIARDPGVWVVWIGCAILTLALFVALYTCHSRYWVTYTKDKGFVVVGWSNKLFLFEPRFEKFQAAFRKEFFKT